MLTKIYLCPTEKKYSCSWEGLSDDILQHFTEEHEDLLSFSNSVSINLGVNSENRLIFVDEEIYLLQIKIAEENLCIFLRYLGPAKIAAKINFDIDIESNNTKLDKKYILAKDGYFSVSLKNIRNRFEDANVLNFVLAINGDFKSNSSDDGVFLENETTVYKEEGVVSKINNEETQAKINEVKENISEIISLSEENWQVKPNVERHPSFNSSDGHTTSIENLFLTPNEGNSPTEIRMGRTNSTDDDNRTLVGNSDVLFEEHIFSKEHKNLVRSKTFGCGETKKRNLAKRCPSSVSLGCIKETDVDLELRCSNCESHLAPPIFLCESDHNICIHCYRNHEHCNICNENITADRNFDLEDKCTNYMYCCKNKKNGCPRKCSYEEIQNHEIHCTFCFYVCPMDECGYKGPFKSMYTHLNLIHSSVKMFESFIAVFQKHTEMFLANEKMGIFYCLMKTLDDRVVWKARFCGPNERKFFCELKFKGKNFKYPLLLVKFGDCYVKEIPFSDLKEYKVKSKNSILTVTR